jgi:predicted porin
MNKKLVTLAVAAALAAPAIASADAILYGKLNVGINYVDQNEGFKGWGLSDNRVIKYAFDNQYLGIYNPFITTPQGPSNRLGVKGSEDLGNGLKAIYQIELGFSISDSNNNGAVNNETITMRNTFVGLAGNFGTVLMGRHDTPLKISTGPLDLFADTLADNNNTVGFQDLRVDNAVAYISPSFSGFQFAGAVHAGGGSYAFGGYNNNSDSLAEAYSFAGIYKNGPWYASLAYEGINSELNPEAMGNTCGLLLDGRTVCAGANYPIGMESQTWGKWRVGLGILDWNGFTLTGIYENWQNGMFTDDQKADLWNVQAGYTFGQFMIKAGYGSNTQKGSNFFNAGGYSYEDIGYDAWAGDDYNFKTWVFGVDYNMSKRTKAFMLYTDNTTDSLAVTSGGLPVSGPGEFEAMYENKWQGFQLGMMHSF